MKKLFFCLTMGICLSLLTLQAQNNLYKNLYETTLHVVKSNSADLASALQKDDVNFLESYFSEDNIGSLGLDCLLLSCVYNSSKCTQFLLDKSVNPSLLKGDKNPLLHAVYNESVDVLTALLNTNLDLYPSLPKNNTLLHFATTHGKVYSLPPLINAGMAINQTEATGNTPLHISLLKSYNHCTHQLLQLQADVNIANLNSMYPLHLAVEDNNKQAVLALLAAKANTQVVNDDGFLPLHYAIKNENVELIELLLQCMPSINEEASEQNTYDLAKSTKNKTIKSLIKNRLKTEKGLYASVRFQHPICSQSCDGQIQIEVQNGKPPYVYSWDHDSQVEENTAADLCSGQYNIQVKDKKKKTYSVTVQLKDPKKISTIVLKDFDKNAHPNTNIKGLAEGGTPPYKYQWNDKQTGQYALLESANHQLTVMDVMGCSTQKNFDINAASKVIGKVVSTDNQTSVPDIKNNEDLAISTEVIAETGSEDIPNNLLDFEVMKALTYFEHENVNVIILSDKGNEVGRFTIKDYLNRLRLLDKYEPSIMEKELNEQGKISLLYVKEVVK